MSDSGANPAVQEDDPADRAGNLGVSAFTAADNGKPLSRGRRLAFLSGVVGVQLVWIGTLVVLVLWLVHAL